MIQFTIVTLFPDFFESPLKVGQVGRGIRDGLVKVQCIDLRDFAVNSYGTVDDRSYGGGPGMVLKIEPLVAVVESITGEEMGAGRKGSDRTNNRLKIWAMSPSGVRWTQELVEKTASSFSAVPESAPLHVVLFCGRYEGFDQRFIDHYVDQEISIGDYVLNGGESAAWVVMESLCRFIPGIVGKGESVQNDSFSKNPVTGERLLDCAHYTTPSEFRGLKVPDVLLSGHHQKVSEWRQDQARLRTAQRQALVDIPPSLR